MIKNIILAFVAFITFSASAENIYTNDIPANTITIRALIDKKDLVSIRGDKVWLTNIKGEFPTNIVINGNSWTPILENENESDTFTMKNPSRFLPMNEERIGLILISLAQTNVAVKVTEYPNEFNEWILTFSLNNMKTDEATWADVTISWKKENEPIILPRHYVVNTRPSPTPVGLR